MNTAFQIISYAIKSAVIALVYFIVSYNFIYGDIAGGDLLTATIWNIVFIFSMLTLEKIEAYFFGKIIKIEKTASETPSLSSKIKYALFVDTPLKPALYFFFIVLLVCSAIVSVDPDFPMLSDYSNYLNSVEYGLLILIASDAFLDQVTKQIEKAKGTLH